MDGIYFGSYVAPSGTTTIDLSAASFSFSAKTIQNAFTASITSPTFNFDGQDITQGAVWFLNATSFGFDSTNVAISQTVKPSAAALNLSPNAQNHTVSVQQDSPPTFDWAGQPLQNTTVLPLSAPAFGFVGKAIAYVAGAAYPLTAAILSLSAKSPVPTLTIPLTAATLNMQPVGNLELLQDGVPMVGPLRLLPQVGVGL